MKRRVKVYVSGAPSDAGIETGTASIGVMLLVWLLVEAGHRRLRR
jgi:hypothetical protein